MSQPDATLNNATLHLASLLKNDLETYEVEGSGRLMPNDDLLQADGLRLGTPLDWHVTVQRTGGDDDYLVSGSVSGAAVQECRRCLTDVSTDLRADFIYPMLYKPGTKELTLLETDEDGEDTLLFGQPEVDFAPLLTQIFAIDLPLTVLCMEACRGLSADGVNLNEHPEHQAPVQEQKEESPFSVLKNLEL